MMIFIYILLIYFLYNLYYILPSSVIHYVYTNQYIHNIEEDKERLFNVLSNELVQEIKELEFNNEYVHLFNQSTSKTRILKHGDVLTNVVVYIPENNIKWDDDTYFTNEQGLFYFPENNSIINVKGTLKYLSNTSKELKVLIH